MKKIMNDKKIYLTPACKVCKVISEMEMMTVSGGYGINDIGTISTPSSGNSVLGPKIQDVDLSSKMNKQTYSKGPLDYGDEEALDTFL